MTESHTPTSVDETTAQPGDIRLVSTADRGLPDRLAGLVDGHLATFADHVREGLLAASTAVGLEVMADMMAVEVTDLAGPKGRHDADRTHTRHGTEDGSVTLGGRRVPVQRPRVRTVGDDVHEVTLDSYTTLTDTDLLAEGIVGRMLAGISTRRYPIALEPVGSEVERSARSTSKSAVSRRFVTATAERLADLCARPLGDRHWPVVMLDGVHLGEHLMVVALGITDDGTKVPLGVVEGSTENAAVCTRLVADLVDRGLDATDGVLFVVDGGKALAKAIRVTFGNKALIQRCRRHKERNILDHLPAAEQPLVQRRLRVAWALPDATKAVRELESIARSLDKKRPGAAASLREGLADTVTVNRLGITGSLLKTVESTNPCESMIEIVRDHSRRVKRWQHGEMALRWAAAGMLAAEAQFRRVRGFKQMPQLVAALQELTADEPGLLDVHHAVTA
jgi:transposase-like protein